MSVFADTPWSGFDSNPFGWDSVHNSSPFRGFGFGSGRGLFEDDRGRSNDDDILSSKMKSRSAGPTLAERGFYDHFDSIFHDLNPGSRRRGYDIETAAAGEEGGRRQSSQNGGKGREYVIPIKIERVATSPSSASKKPDTFVKTKSPSRLPSDRGAIEIPIIRETSTRRENSRDQQGTKYSAPSHFKLLTPATEKDRRTNSRQTISDADAACMSDCDDSFPSRKSSFSDSVEVIEVEEEETRTSRRRKPSRHSPDDVSSTASNKSATSSSSSADDSSPRNFASSSSIRNADNVTIIDIKNNVEKKRESEYARQKPTAAGVERRKVPCSSAGNIDVTPAPSYPIYDLLKPRRKRDSSTTNPGWTATQTGIIGL
ncbi:hypothetical protein BaRGS_00035577 [Batillaria attramentaria]|uniref:Uncharacterized protein n=1 Tax=Batillaria attramentaria TaxID=370345 RepID=A0ABD0JDL3_9CAEN